MNHSIVRIVCGYFCAVTAAALCQAIWWAIGLHQLHIVTLHELVEVFYLGWGYAFIMALFPFVIGVHLEFDREITNPLFFVAGAVTTAILLVLPKVYFFEGGVFDESNASFLERCWDYLPMFAASGFAAGTVYYFIRRSSTRDRLRRAER